MAARDTGRAWAAGFGVLAGSVAVLIVTVGPAATPFAGSPRAVAATATATASASAKVSGAALPSELNNYMYATLAIPSKNLQTALATIQTNWQAKDWDSLQVGCRQLRAAGRQFEDTLPSPDSRITPRIQGAADDMLAAADICATFGPDSTAADYDPLNARIVDAFKRIKSAQLIR